MNGIFRFGIALLAAFCGAFLAAVIVDLYLTGLPATLQSAIGFSAVGAWGSVSYHMLSKPPRVPRARARGILGLGRTVLLRGRLFVVRLIIIWGLLALLIGIILGFADAGKMASLRFLSYLNIAPPEMSGSIIAGLGVVLAAMITLFGGKVIESRAAAKGQHRVLQLGPYQRTIAWGDGIVRGTSSPSSAIEELEKLRPELLSIASNGVIDALSKFILTLKRVEFDPKSQADFMPCEEAFRRLLIAIRADLGFRPTASEDPWPWRNLDPKDPRREKASPPDFLDRMWG